MKEGRNNSYIYDKGKTAVDIVFYRNKVGIEETKEVLLNYFRSKNRDLNKLLEYAKEDEMREYSPRILRSALI